ncbi:hypothetical protein GCM10010339_03270 [Streptomyces alanosinicus]|uniref:N-acetylmuramoyl-L-alanine amidase n=1 Tax=Streptomyces alanosinicus TaxID=68171 RepID=A0A919CZQ9_9ACTN|nr:hypothetical protein GCM10010339_03270 [Streptomyces alanosinicus]
MPETPEVPEVPETSGTQRQPEAPRTQGTRSRFARRISGPLPALLGVLPGLVAIVALVLCARGVERTTASHPDRPVPARAPAVHRAARPHIVPRSVWLGTAGRTQPPPRYDDKVVAVFLHHTDSPGGYDCADAPSIIRHLYAGQTGDRRWDDIGYNFLVDRCGTIYEGRAGGIERAVTGAHTQGFNHRTAGIAAIGTFTAGVPVPKAMTDAIAALAAWKLGLADVDPRTSTRLVSSNGHSRYKLGATATLPVLAGHTDGFMTSCPGAALRARLPEIREKAARLQGRTTSMPVSDRTPPTPTQSPSVPAPLLDRVAPAPVQSPFAPAPLLGWVAPAPLLDRVAPAPLLGRTAPAPLLGWVVPVPVQSPFAPGPLLGRTAAAPLLGWVAPAPVRSPFAPAPLLGRVTPVPVQSPVAPAPLLGRVASAPLLGRTAVAPLLGRIDPAPLLSRTAPVPLPGRTAPVPLPGGIVSVPVTGIP